MDTHCEHILDYENFLFDDTTVVKRCVKCRRNWDSESNSWVRNGAMDDDILEDSPLLINDCYLEQDGFHCHAVLKPSNEDLRAWKKLLLASVFCFLFMVVELVGGLVAGSLAIMTDAAHLFSDFVGFLISLLSIWVAKKSPTKNMTFGYHRAEVLGALLSVLSVWLLAAIFAMLAVNRLWKKAYEIDADTMMLVASLGLTVNIVMGVVLYGFCHNHTHSAASDDNINVRAAAAHVLGDLLQSFGVLVAAIIIKVFPNAKLADPVCTLIFSVVVICTTAQVARDSIWLLLEGSPVSTTELANGLGNIANVRHLHGLHVWSLSPGKEAVAAHLSVDKFCDRDAVLKKATSLIQSKFNVVSCTIQVETYNSDMISSCRYCNADGS